jgi:ATP-binding cassette subfamily B protein
MYDQSVRSAVLSSLLMPLVMSIGSVGVALILWQGGVETINGVITLGTLSFFLTLGSMFFDPINNVARIFAELQSSQAAVERVITLVDTQPEITDTEKVTEKFGGVFDTPKETWPKIIGKVDFDHVTFRYGDGTAVLRDFSLHVRAGETIALVGETGSGKSTIVNLLCRFYEPTQGRILIDGVDYRERSQLWLHSNLGYVLQSPHLFSGTIRDNIRYGKLTATDAEIENVARLIGAHAFIGRLEHGYDTQVGEGGGLLSTGEKQLISFARAILANPALFILDEATSSIDTEAEQAIQFAIDRVRGGRTSFIIAHRLSTIRNADRILVIDRGRILEEGTHAQLMRRRGHYYELYTTQFRQEAEDAALGCPPVPENV